MFKSITFPLLLVACFLINAAPKNARADERPNIVFILADDVGREVLGCYGGRSYSTPNIDSLAADGMSFHHCYSMPVCHPTRICLLTGRYPQTLGNPAWGNFPADEQKNTFANALQKAGYATAVAGKWQLELLKNNPQHPHQLGFDQYAVFGWHEGPRYHKPFIYRNGEVMEGTEDRYGPDIYVEFLIDFMKSNRERPFFAWYSMALCHDVTDDTDTPPPFYKDNRWMTYSEMVASMDLQVGRLLTAFKTLGLEKNTIVVFTGDNGTPVGSYIDVRDGKMRKQPVVSLLGDREIPGGKGRLTDWGTRVPLLIRWPGVIGPATTVNDLVDFSDFMPTFLALAGADAPGGVKLDGVSFAPRLTGKGASPRKWAYSEKGKTDAFWTRTAHFKLYNDGRFFAMDDTGEESAPLDTSALTSTANDAYELLSEALREVQD